MHSTPDITQLPLPLAEAALPERGDEAIWIEPHRGRPLLPGERADASAITRVFGRSFAEAAPSDAEWQTTLHPGDRARVLRRRASGKRFDVVYRIVRPDGGTPRVRDRAHRLGDQSLLRIVSVLADAPVVETKASTSPDASAPRWIERALDEAIVRCDRTGRMVEVIGPTDLLPVPAEHLVGHRVIDVAAVPIEVRMAWAAGLERVFDTLRPQIRGYRTERDGTTREHEVRFVPVDAGQAVLVIRDVAERNRLRERLEHFALHDLLTGLPNLRALREHLVRWLRPGASRDPVSPSAVVLLVVDLDRFKQTVDLQGRSVGDGLLRIVSQRLRRVAQQALHEPQRDADVGTRPPMDPRADEDLVVARIGGDQFAVACRLDLDHAMPGDADDRAVLLANRLLAALAEPTRLAGQVLFVRASIGDRALGPFRAGVQCIEFVLQHAALLETGEPAGQLRSTLHALRDVTAGCVGDVLAEQRVDDAEFPPWSERHTEVAEHELIQQDSEGVNIC